MPDKNSIWASFISIGLHVVILALLFVTLPVPAQNDKLDDVQVELVPPPAVPELSQPEQGLANNHDIGQATQAFESATNSSEENTETEPVTPEEALVEQTEPIEEVVQEERAETLENEPVLSVDQSSISTTVLEKQEAKMKAAKQIYSDGALSDPRVKQALGQLSAKERVSQICGIEALEQVRHDRPDTPPDMMARTGNELTETSLKMRGGAFRSRSKWYSLDFKCEIDSDALKVKSFEYVIGDLISEEVRQRRSLPMD